jgi:hypothetical protein
VGRVEVAFNERELVARLDQFVAAPPSDRAADIQCSCRSAGCPWAAAEPCAPHPGTACPHLLATLRDFIGVDVAAGPRTGRPQNSSPLSGEARERVGYPHVALAPRPDAAG